MTVVEARFLTADLRDELVAFCSGGALAAALMLVGCIDSQQKNATTTCIGSRKHVYILCSIYILLYHYL